MTESATHLQSARPVFILGTGRCGTASLARVLAPIAGDAIQHEAEPKLLEEVTDLIQGRQSENELAAILRATRGPLMAPSDSSKGTPIAGESNQRLSYCIPSLAQAFPDARYVWLIRDGRDNVASMHHRFWYWSDELQRRPREVHGWVHHRIRGDHVGDVDAATWTSMDGFARCCWYWSYTNRLIERETQRLNLPVLRMNLETLSEQVGDLAEHLDLGDAGNLKAVKANAASSGAPIGWRAWSGRQRRVFDQWAGAEMDRWYPQWRAERGANPIVTLPLRVARTVRRDLGHFWRTRNASVIRGESVMGGN